MIRGRGSALVFVLIIVAGIVTVTVGTQRLALVQFNQTAREEDNLFAYYGAKAGVEDGLLRFRHQRNVETPENKVHRFDVTTGRSYGEIDATTKIQEVPDYDPSHQYYDLGIDFRTHQVGDFAFATDPPLLKKDSEIQLTGFPNSTNYAQPFYLRYAFNFIGENCRADEAFVQVQQIISTPTAETNYSQVTAKVGANNRFDSKDSANAEISNGSNLSSYFRIRAYKCDVQYAFTTTKSLTGDGEGSDQGPKFDSLITKMTATGYFGKAKRTVEVKVDRVSGIPISVTDFNIYSGEGSIRPRN